MTALLAVTLAAMSLEARRRLRLVARAEHELRGALTGLALADAQTDLARARTGLADLSAARRGRRARPQADAVRLDRLLWQAATRADLAARRRGGAVRLEWRGGDARVRADYGRLAQAVGNLLDNAIEHGGGHVWVVGERTRTGFRVVVSDAGAGGGPPAAGGEDIVAAADRGHGPAVIAAADRGHGLAITAAAVRDCGGRLTRLAAERGTAIAIDLPLGG